MQRIWSLAACSGMTPPVRVKLSLDVAMILESTRVPSSTTAAAVSSHDVSIAKIRMSRSLAGIHLVSQCRYYLSMPASVEAPVVFLARRWHGHGGMQRLNRLLARRLTEEMGERFTCVHPRSASVFSTFSWLVRSFCIACHALRSGAHVHLSDAALIPLGAFCHRLCGGRVSACACGLDVTYSPWWYQKLLRFSLPHIHTVVCISHWTKAQLRSRGVADDRIVIIPCIAVPRPARTSPQTAIPLLLSVGRLVPRKGIAWFVQHVLPLVLEQRPVRYAVVGSGSQESVIRTAIEQAQVSHAVAIVRDATDAERDALYQEAALLVMPNVPIEGDGEGFGIVCIEASAGGIPVVAARLEGLQDSVIEGRTGAFFSPLDAADCARVILEMLARPLEPGDVLQATHDAFGWERVLPRYLALFRG